MDYIPDQFIRTVTVAMPPCYSAKEFRNGVRKRWGAVATCQYRSVQHCAHS